jgi:hypothetical protein
MKRVKVTAAVTAVGMTYDFGMSNVRKARIRAMEHVSYFLKGHARSPSPEIVPTPQLDEAIVFENLFSAGFCMPPHPVLTEIL